MGVKKANGADDSEIVMQMLAEKDELKTSDSKRGNVYNDPTSYHLAGLHVIVPHISELE